mmetsp:Transcript_38003/g.75343  ORF Transcript_38003/g.75343 Transcript_38003/m.75343 type:complete len:90 (-) Transcript_38003:297-566(-)
MSSEISQMRLRLQLLDARAFGDLDVAPVQRIELGCSPNALKLRHTYRLMLGATCRTQGLEKLDYAVHRMKRSNGRKAKEIHSELLQRTV